METIELVRTCGAILAAVSAVALVAVFARGARAVGRASTAIAFALFTGLVLVSCAEPGGFAVPAASPVLLFPLLAVELLALNGVMVLIARGATTNATLVPLGVALALAVVYTVAPGFAEGAGAPAVGKAVDLLALLGLWGSFSLVALAASSAVYRLIGQKIDPGADRAYDFILVHGCALYGTRPSPLLMSRLDCAFNLWQRQGGRGSLVVSGGQGSDEELSEASAMGSYLRDRGVPADRIIEEDRSTTTRENLTCSRELMDRASEGAPYRVALVTSEFHAYRCVCEAVRLGMDADGVGAPSKGDSWLRSIGRELGAVTARHLWTYGAVAALWALGLLLP